MKALEKFYLNETPDYVVNAGKTFIVIRVSDWQGSKNLKVTVRDVVLYYRTQANNIVSGCRTLAGHTGDWRPIDALAKECLEWFKAVNIELLRREGRKEGLIPKF